MNYLFCFGRVTCFGGIVLAGYLFGSVRTHSGVEDTRVRAAVFQDAATPDEIYLFSKDDVGNSPDGWIASVTGAQKGAAPEWKVMRDEGKVVLAQLESGGANGDFPVCLKEGSSFKDGAVSIRFKSISGKIDQAGGVVFRAQDKDNFYIARANALEDNVSFYVTVDGKRKTIKYWKDIGVAIGEWHELKVEANGSSFKVWLNGSLVGEIDDAKKTFPNAGMVGLWTKADSITYFDNVKIGD